MDGIKPPFSQSIYRRKDINRGPASRCPREALVVGVKVKVGAAGPLDDRVLVAFTSTFTTRLGIELIALCHIYRESTVDLHRYSLTDCSRNMALLANVGIGRTPRCSPRSIAFLARCRFVDCSLSCLRNSSYILCSRIAVFCTHEVANIYLRFLAIFRKIS